MISYLEELNLNSLSKKLHPLFENIEPNFDKISELLQNKYFIKDNKDFLQLIGIKLNPYHLRMFLSTLMLKHCPDEILNERKAIEESLIENGSSLLNTYLQILKCPKEDENFSQRLNNFLVLYQSWKEQDKSKFLFLLSSSYNELKITQKIIEMKDQDNVTKIWLEEIEKQKKTLEKSVYQVGGEIAIEKMIDGSFWLDMITPEYKDLIDTSLKKQFRTKLIDELNNDKIPYTIIKCLKEIKAKNENLEKLKIEILNNNLPKNDKKNIIEYNLKIIMNEIFLDEKIDTKAENIIELLIKAYDKIVK